MTQTEEKIENFTNAVGADLSSQFEKQVSSTINELIVSLEHLLIDDETKVDYATHVFAKALDEMVDFLGTPKLLNWDALIYGYLSQYLIAIDVERWSDAAFIQMVISFLIFFGW